MSFMYIKNNETTELYGRDVKFAKTLSEVLNFKLDFKIYREMGFVLQNGSSKRPLKALIDEESDISITDWWLKENRMKILGTSTTYSSGQLAIMVPPPRPLSTFEKCIFPFSWPLWTLILVCYLLGNFSIFLVKRKSKVIQDFVFGENASVPYLNLFIGFIGGVQNFLPKYNFARFLLMMFLLYSLIIRTAYQGMFYELLKSNIHHKEIQSIDELLAKKFTVYCSEGSEDLLDWSEALKMR
jgi:hypothetical protein